METLQAKIERLNAELAEINQKESFNQDDIDRRNQITNEISDAEYRLKQEQDQQEREVKQVQTLDGLQDLVLGYNFNDIFKNPEANKLIHKLLHEHTQALLTEHNQEVGGLNDKINSLTQQLTESGNQLVAANNVVAEKASQLSDVTAELTEEKADHEQTKHELATIRLTQTQRDADNIRLTNVVDELKRQLEAAQKPKADFKPSESLSDIVANAKKASETWEQKAQRGVQRWAGILPEIVAPPIPALTEVAQPGNTFPQAEPESNTVHPTEEVAKEGITFPTSEQPDGLSVDRNGAVQENDGQAVTREEFEALKSRVAKLETEPMKWGA